MIRDGNHAHASRLVSVEYTEALDNNEDAFQNMSGLVSWIQNNYWCNYNIHYKTECEKRVLMWHQKAFGIVLNLMGPCDHRTASYSHIEVFK